MSDVAVAENMAPEEEPQVVAEAPKRPHRSAAQNAARQRPAAAPARPAARPASSLPPRKGYIRLLCVQDYTHGQRIQISAKIAKELEGMADYAPKDVKAAVKRYEAGTEYSLEAGQAARLLRDKGPARYRDPVSEKIVRRQAADIYFRAVDPEELQEYLDREIDKINERLETAGVADVNDQAPLDEEDDE